MDIIIRLMSPKIHSLLAFPEPDPKLVTPATVLMQESHMVIL